MKKLLISILLLAVIEPLVAIEVENYMPAFVKAVDEGKEVCAISMLRKKLVDPNTSLEGASLLSYVVLEAVAQNKTTDCEGSVGCRRAY